MSRNFMFYTLKFFVPYRLLFIYPKWSLLSSDAVLMVVGSILIGISYVWALFSSKWRPKLVPISIAVAGFLPVSGLIYIPYMKYSYVADHWAYVMVAGMALGLSQIFSIFQNHLPKNTSKVFLIVFIMMLAAVQSNYARVFNNTTEMLERNIKYSPDSPFPYQYLARLYLQNNNFYEATRVIERGLKAAPNDEQLLKLKEEASSID